jgi:hypothetical protein
MHTRRFASTNLRQIALEQRIAIIRSLHKGAASQSDKPADVIAIDERALEWYLEFESARWNRLLDARKSDVRFWFACACVLSVAAFGALVGAGQAAGLMSLLAWLVLLLVLGSGALLFVFLAVRNLAEIRGLVRDGFAPGAKQTMFTFASSVWFLGRDGVYLVPSTGAATPDFGVHFIPYKALEAATLASYGDVSGVDLCIASGFSVANLILPPTADSKGGEVRDCIQRRISSSRELA